MGMTYCRNPESEHFRQGGESCVNLVFSLDLAIEQVVWYDGDIVPKACSLHMTEQMPSDRCYPERVMVAAP